MFLAVLILVIAAACFGRSLRAALASLFGVPRAAIADARQSLSSNRTRLDNHLAKVGDDLKVPAERRLPVFLFALLCTALCALFVGLEYTQVMPSLLGLLDDPTPAPAIGSLTTMMGVSICATTVFGFWVLTQLTSKSPRLLITEKPSISRLLMLLMALGTVASSLTAAGALAIYRTRALEAAAPLQSELVEPAAADPETLAIEGATAPEVLADVIPDSRALVTTAMISLTAALTLAAVLAAETGPMALILTLPLWLGCVAKWGIGLLAGILAALERACEIGYGILRPALNLIQALGITLSRPILAAARGVHSSEEKRTAPRLWVTAATSWSKDVEIPDEPIGQTGIPDDSAKPTGQEQAPAGAETNPGVPPQEPESWSPFPSQDQTEPDHRGNDR